MLGRDGRGTAVVAIALGVAMVAGCTGDKTESPAPGTTVASSAVTSTQAPSSAMPSGTSVSASSAGSSVSLSVTADPALVAEAKKVNQRQFDLEMTFTYPGGLPPGTPPPMFFTDVMMGKGLSLTMDLLYNTFNAGVHRKSGQVKLGPASVVDLTRDGSLIALRACRDGREVTLQREDGSTYKGVLVRHTTYYKRDKDGMLKMSSWSGVEDEKCAG